jgi:DNA polymerase I
MNKYQKLFKEMKDKKPLLDQNVNDRILICDGLNTFIRAFGATPATNEDGDHIGGITGFLYSIGKCVRDFKPTRCVVVFDGRGGSKRRKTINKSYKANRANKTRLRRHDHAMATIEDEQDAMRHQFSRLVSYLDNLPVTFLAIDGIEADDTIAYIAELYRDKSKEITIVSTDRDFYQMIDETIRVWSPIKKKMYNAETVHEEFNVTPQNYVMYRTFTGDKSDNIEGVHGIGPKTLLKHVPELSGQKEFTPDEMFKKSEQLLDESKTYKKIIENRDIIEQNYQLMNLKLLDFSATHTSNIRRILEQPIPSLNKAEFQRLFMEDKMWTTMKNAPDWLNKTWLSLHAFAQQTQK